MTCGQYTTDVEHAEFTFSSWNNACLSLQALLDNNRYFEYFYYQKTTDEEGNTTWNPCLTATGNTIYGSRIVNGSQLEGKMTVIPSQDWQRKITFEKPMDGYTKEQIIEYLNLIADEIKE